MLLDINNDPLPRDSLMPHDSYVSLIKIVFVDRKVSSITFRLDGQGSCCPDITARYLLSCLPFTAYEVEMYRLFPKQIRFDTISTIRYFTTGMVHITDCFTTFGIEVFQVYLLSVTCIEILKSASSKSTYLSACSFV